MFRVDNYIIEKPIEEILYDIKLRLTNGKLRDIKVKAEEIVVTCPVHSSGLEAVPDCHISLVNTDRVSVGGWHCFSCGNSGDMPKFAAACFDSSIEYAKQWLIDNYGVLAYNKIDLGEDIKPAVNKRKATKIIDSSELDNYQNWCQYLSKRGILYETAKKFNIKYDPKFRQVVFPIYDEKDNLIMLAKRNIDTKVFFMTEGVEKPLYCFNNIVKNHEHTAMVVEGLFDCLKGNQFGIPTFATLGEISPEQIEKINKSEITHLYLCFDNDTAGARFTSYMEKNLAKRILITKINLPAGKKDIGELNYEEFKKCFENS